MWLVPFAVVAVLGGGFAGVVAAGAGEDNVVRIHDASGLIELSNNVNNNGMNYSGSTVVLDSDIDFSEELSRQSVHIGKNRVEQPPFQGSLLQFWQPQFLFNPFLLLVRVCSVFVELAVLS